MYQGHKKRPDSKYSVIKSRHSLRTVGDSLKEHNSHSPILNSYRRKLIIRHAHCQTYVCMILI
jgi:hypothetical protein